MQNAVKHIDLFPNFEFKSQKENWHLTKHTQRDQSLITKRFKFKIVKNKKKNYSNFLDAQVIYLNSLLCPKPT